MSQPFLDPDPTSAEREAAKKYQAIVQQRYRENPLAKALESRVINRLFARYYHAADTAFFIGSTPWEVDEAMVAFGFATGPYEAEDLIGLDTAFESWRAHDLVRQVADHPVPLANRMLELGKLGKKTGAGWYRYPGGNGKVEDPIVADLALEEAYFSKVVRVEYSENEIQALIVLSVVHEALEILGSAEAIEPFQLDAIAVKAVGFPELRGGILYFAKQIGNDALNNGFANHKMKIPMVSVDGLTL